MLLLYYILRIVDGSTDQLRVPVASANPNGSESQFVDQSSKEGQISPQPQSQSVSRLAESEVLNSSEIASTQNLIGQTNRDNSQSFASHDGGL